MDAMMMERPLRISDILAFAAEVHGDGEVVSADDHGNTRRVGYKDAAVEVAKLAHGLRSIGVV
ncbi:MAG: long-chain fatty acid--CoA ligase, partial [Pseudomonadota bacterium]